MTIELDENLLANDMLYIISLSENGTLHKLVMPKDKFAISTTRIDFRTFKDPQKMATIAESMIEDMFERLRIDYAHELRDEYRYSGFNAEVYEETLLERDIHEVEGMKEQVQVAGGIGRSARNKYREQQYKDNHEDIIDAEIKEIENKNDDRDDNISSKLGDVHKNNLKETFNDIKEKVKPKLKKLFNWCKEKAKICYDKAKSIYENKVPYETRQKIKYGSIIGGVLAITALIL